MSSALHTKFAPMFAPRSVAVVGASSTPGKLGYEAFKNIRGCGYEGAIYGINASGGDGDPQVFTRIGDVGKPVDCAMILLPATKMVEAVRECAAAGVRSVVVGASGFAETGTDWGRAAQAEIGRIARDAGMLLLGPNTNGLVSAPAMLSLGFNFEHAPRPVDGPVSFVSHSGAILAGISTVMRNLGAGYGHFVAVGNEVDISMLDVIEYLIENDGTTAIGLVMEGLSDGERFAELAMHAWKANKRIVVLKVGRSSAGARAALAHSSRLAGSVRAYEALLEHCAVPMVRSVEALAGACVTLTSNPRFNLPGRMKSIDRRLNCITGSGAGGAILVDWATDRGIPLAFGDGEIDQQPIRGELDAIPSSSPIGHPLDTGTLRSDATKITTYLQLLEKHGRNGPVAVYKHSLPSPSREGGFLEQLTMRKARTDAPVVAIAPGGLPAEVQQMYRDAGIPLFPDFASCTESLAATFFFLGREEPQLLASPQQGRPAARFDAQQGALEFLSEIDSARILSAAGIPVVPSRLVASAQDVEAAVGATSGRWVMKALPPGVAHKNDAGMVLLGLGNKAEAVRAFNTLGERLAAQGHGADTPRILQPMLPSKGEIIAGVTHEPGLGYFLLLGLGGVHAEVLDEVLLFPIAAPRPAMVQKIAASRIGRLLARVAPAQPVVEQLTDILDGLRRLVWSYGEAIDSIDINPVMVTAEGCVAVDALICPRHDPPG